MYRSHMFVPCLVRAIVADRILPRKCINSVALLSTHDIERLYFRFEMTNGSKNRETNAKVKKKKKK